jgi:hypothetical protein
MNLNLNFGSLLGMAFFPLEYVPSSRRNRARSMFTTFTIQRSGTIIFQDVFPALKKSIPAILPRSHRVQRTTRLFNVPRTTLLQPACTLITCSTQIGVLVNTCITTQYKYERPHSCEPDRRAQSCSSLAAPAHTHATILRIDIEY